MRWEGVDWIHVVDVEVVVANFKVLFRHLPRSTEEIHDKSQPGYLSSLPRLEPPI